jgi:tetratricopeptide (TPR) repeat protein
MQLALRPLGAEDSRRLVRAVCAERALPPAMEDEVIAIADGNPFFLEELARAMRGAEGGVSRPVIPDSVHAVLAARIDRLAPEDKRLLQVAAVIGRHVPLALLERVSGESAAVLAARLARLAAAELLLETGAAERAYLFKHALTHTAAYESLPPALRRDLHGRALAALEAAGDPRPEGLEERAHHAVQGADWARAVAYLREAGDIAAHRRAQREAVRCLEGALAALARLPGRPGAEAEACDLRFDLAMAVYMSGELGRAVAEYEESARLAERLDDDRRRGRVLWALVFLQSAQGNHAAATRTAERALALAEATRDHAGQVWAAIGLTRTCLVTGDYRRGVESGRAAVSALADEPIDTRLGVPGVPLPAVSARAWLALCLARTGDFDEGARHGEEAIRIADAVGAHLDRFLGYYALARVLHAQTDFDGAIALLQRAVGLLEEHAFPLQQPWIVSGLASSLVQAGRVDEGLALLDRARAAARAIDLRYGDTLILVQLSEATLAAGRLEEAQGHAAEALRRAQARGERADEAWALHLHGSLAARRVPPARDEARGWFDQALDLAEGLGMRPLAARCRLSLGALELELGERATAAGHARAAVAAIRAMGLERWRAGADELLAAAESAGP